MKYCIGCVSFDAAFVLDDSAKKCPACGTSEFVSEEQFVEHMRQVERVVLSQLPRVGLVKETPA